MSDESRTTLAGLIGRQHQPQPERSAVSSARDQVSRAHAVWLVLATHLRGLERAGVVDERSAARIASAVDSLGDDDVSSTSSVRSMQRAFEDRVDSALPDELRGAAKLGLAQEEWAGTVLRVMASSDSLAAAKRAGEARQAMLAMTELHAVTLMQGFHTGRPVQPVTFGHLLGGAIAPLGTGLTRLLDAIDRLNRSPLGAGSMSGEVVGAERAETARWLGFREPIPNTYDAVANIEDFVAVAESLASVGAPVARLLDELAVMVRTDPSSLVFDDAWMREGDRHLPGFTAVERLVSLAQELRAGTYSATALVGRLRQLPYGPLGVAVDWIADDLTGLASQTAEQFDAVDELFRTALTVNRAYLANRAGRDFTTSSDLAAFLMSEEQLTPSVARDVAGLTLRRLREENLEISAITPEHVDLSALMVIGRELKVEPETLGRWLAPRRFLERRLVEGSPAPSMTREWIEGERAANQQVMDRIASRRLQVRDAEASVRAWVADAAREGEDT
ncbi:MAG: hypothetical protein H0U38_07270 [Chloroflexia bacterium]|nr:hypothetical protein [Chloroflexia bacterium]MDQ3615019.1 lyase family protein [Chloroflexota bacterium]